MGVPFSQFGCEGPVNAYRKLRQLSLELDYEHGYTNDSVGDQRCAEDLRGFISVLQAAQGIESLRLGIDSFRIPACSHSATFATVVAAKAKGLILPSIPDLDLQFHSVELPVLLDFLRGSCDTLRTLRTNRVRDGGADYGDLAGRFWEALGIPGSAPRERNFIHSTCDDAYKERILHHPYSRLQLSFCYDGDWWMERDRTHSCRTVFRLPEQEWPRE